MTSAPTPMPASAQDIARHINVTSDDQALGQADVVTGDQCLCVTFHISGGHIPPGTRPRLVEQVFALADVGDQDELQAAVPLGDTELLDALRDHCSSMQTRAAGATCLVDGLLTHCDQCDAAEHQAAALER